MDGTHGEAAASLETTHFFTPNTSRDENGRSRHSTVFFTPQSSRLEDSREEEQGLSFEEAQAVREASVEAVKRVLGRLGVILNSAEFDLSPVIYRDSDTGTSESFLHMLLWKPMLRSGVPSQAYRRAADLVLADQEQRAAAGVVARRRVGLLVSMKESAQGMTALHMATMKWGKAMVRRLLALGADLCVGDVLGELPVARVQPVVLEEFLDTKWWPRGYPEDHPDHQEDLDPDNEHYTIEFDFSFLQGAEGKSSGLGSTRVLEELARSPHHRRLLTHPVVTTFLALQWEHISLGYNLNTAFNLITCVVTNLFILAIYGGESVLPLSSRANWTSCEPSWSPSTFPSVFQEPATGALTAGWATLLLCSLALAARELLQAAVAWANGELCMHLSTLENWLEAVFVLCSLALAAATALPEHPVCAMRAVAATALLISWVLFFHMVARNPNFHRQNLHITMFFRVMQMFVKIFLIFAPYILAFGIFFYISLHKDFENDIEMKEEAGNTCSAIKQEILQEINQKGEFLDKVGFSVLKTLAMFVGELEFSDIPFNNAPYFSHITFLVFVFLIVVVLMNLLTGLAVRSPESCPDDPSCPGRRDRPDSRRGGGVGPGGPPGRRLEG
jgi:hypothetical protein